MKEIHISKMEERDLERVIEIQKELFTSELQEDISIFRRKWELYPEGCWVIKNKKNIIGYLVSHPWIQSSPPDLGSYIKELPKKPDCLYLHEIGILTRLAGKRMGYVTFQKFKNFAKQKSFSHISGISVMKSKNFWKRNGAVEVKIDKEKTNKLKEHYGTEACYMTTAV